MSHYLLLFTFSPVQEFISQARKTQDLYAASYILSHLCKTVLEKAKEEYQAEVVYPNNVGNQSYPNRFIAILPETDKDKLARIGQDLQKTAEQHFLEIGEDVLDQVLNKIGSDKNSETIKKLKKDVEKQLNSYLQVYWVFQEFTGNYEEAYNNIESLLGSIKNTRTFQQLPEQGRKCSLTGEHNALFYRKTENSQKPWHIAKHALHIPVSDKLPVKLLKSGEALGAVAFIKRFAEKYFKNTNEFDDNFPSTAEVALFDAFKKLEFKVEPTFEIQAIFDLQNGKELPGNLTDIQKVDVKKIYKKIKEKKINITPYYALIMFDADSMGEFLSGSKLEKGVDLQKLHKTLSKELSKYAVKAAEILQNPYGQVIYAGGDDFLGFINLNYLFETLKELREKFDEIDLTKFTKQKLTFSAGIVIAHFKTPLSEVLKKAKNMEKAAKEIDAAKDAFGLAVLKHSGETVQAVYKWKCDDELTTDLLKRINQKLVTDFSETFIRNLNVVFNKLIDKEGAVLNSDLSEEMEEAGYGEDDLLHSEIKRLVSRSYLHNDDNENTKERKHKQVEEQVEELVEVLKLLYNNKNATANFLALLNIIAFNKKKVKN